MLQILLAFLAISVISTAGYGLVEQLSLQQIMSDQRENIRRMDVAADAIQARLVTMPGVNGVYAPAPTNLNGGTWSYMPAGLGGINATVEGVQFAYCPIAPSSPGSANSAVKSADGSSYGVEVKSGVVVGSELGSSIGLAAGIAAYRPVAFIIAAGRTASAPPSCTAVRERNGRPFVEGGLVKIVSAPVNSSTSGVGTIAAATSDIYVSSTGSGSGRLGDPASFEDALRQWSSFRPAQMTIHLVQDSGAVTASNAAWSDFAAAMSASSGRLTIEGAGKAITGPAVQISVPGVLTLSNVGVQGPTFVVGQGDVMNVQGNVSLAPGLGGSGLYVMQGGRLNVSGDASQRLVIGGGADNGLEVAGDAVLTGGGVVAPGKSWSVGVVAGGRLWAKQTSIGSPDARNTQSAIMVNGATSVTSDLSAVFAAGNGSCWASASAEDYTFSPSTNGNGPGSSSAVYNDANSPGLADPSDPVLVEQYQAWRRQTDERQRARQTNHSNFSCG